MHLQLHSSPPRSKFAVIEVMRHDETLLIYLCADYATIAASFSCNNTNLRSLFYCGVVGLKRWLYVRETLSIIDGNHLSSRSCSWCR